MLVDIYDAEVKGAQAQPKERGIDMRDAVPEVEQIDARYNLETYGQYWVYSVSPPKFLKLTP